MRSLIAFFMVGLISTTAFSSKPLYLGTITNGEDLDVVEDVIISQNSIINIENVNIKMSLYMENHGLIAGDINVCDTCHLHLRNDGDFSGYVNLGDNGKLTQVIKTQEDIKRINVVGSNFSILVQSQSALSLSDIVNIARAADKIILDNTSISLGTGAGSVTADFFLPDIELVGEIVLNLENVQKLNGMILLSNVSGDGVVRIDTPDLDPLFTAATVRKNDNIYLNVYRETDYQKLFNNKTGVFLNQLRTSAPDNKTLGAMDNAKTMAELKTVMKRSVSLNPINLMRPIKLFNNIELGRLGTSVDSISGGIDGIYITSPDMDLYAGRVSVATKIGDVSVSANAYMGAFENADDINEYSGEMFGGNIRGYIDNDSMWIDATLGFTISSFNTDMIFDGTNYTYDPDGMSVYGAGNIGMKFRFYDNIYVAPFVGAGAEYDKVLHQSDTDMFARVGANSVFSKYTTGLRYDYRAFVMAQTNDIQSIGVGMDVWSIEDAAGGGFSYSIMNDEIGISHIFAANVRFVF